MGDDGKIVALLIGCITIGAIIISAMYFDNERRFIEAGYIQVQNVGASGFYWMKP